MCISKSVVLSQMFRVCVLAVWNANLHWYGLKGCRATYILPCPPPPPRRAPSRRNLQRSVVDGMSRRNSDCALSHQPMRRRRIVHPDDGVVFKRLWCFGLFNMILKKQPFFWEIFICFFVAKIVIWWDLNFCGWGVFFKEVLFGLYNRIFKKVV